jgi:hypothetical protein
MIMSKNLLLISEHPEDPSFLSEIALAMGGTVQTEPDPKRAIELLTEQDFAGVYLDVSRLDRLRTFEMEAQKRYGLLGDHLQATRFHFVSDLPLDEKRDVIQSPFFTSFFQRPQEKVTESAKLYARIQMSGENHGSDSVKNILGGQGEVQSLLLERSGQKQEVAEAVRQYLIQGKVPARIANTITNAVDELLMNALYDAPCDDFGRTIYTLTPRGQDRDLQEREKVEMKIGFDGNTFALSVMDRFGSLDRNRLLNHVSVNYKHREYRLRQAGAGAGLGLGAIFQTGGSLVYHCEGGKRTEAVLITSVFENYRDFKSQFRCFSANFYG